MNSVLDRTREQVLQQFRSGWIWPQAIERLKAHRNAILLVILAGLASTAVLLTLPQFAGAFASSVLARHDTFDAAILLVGLFVLYGVLNFASTVLYARVRQRVVLATREAIYARIQRIRLTRLSEQTTGDIVALLENDLQAVIEFLYGNITSASVLVIRLVFATGLMLWMDPLVTIVLIVGGSAIAWLSKFLSDRLKPMTRQMHDRYAETISFVDDNLRLMRLIRSATSEATEVERYRQTNRALFEASQARMLLVAAIPTLMQTLGTALLIMTIYFAVRQDPARNPAEIVEMMLYGFLMWRPIQSLANVYSGYQATRASSDRLDELLDTDALERDPAGEPARFSEAPSIEFRNLGFSYDNGDAVLDNFSLVIPAGEILVLAGTNGAGKSTLVDLLCQFIEPETGQVLVNDVDVKRYELPAFRSQIGLVYQNIGLFNRSLRENVSYGSRAITTTRTSLLDFVSAREEDLDAHAGPGGSRLSGGQRQRVALSRVMGQEFPIVILDEATSMLDPHALASVRQWLESRRGKQTTILVTHDPAAWNNLGVVVDIDAIENQS